MPEAHQQAPWPPRPDTDRRNLSTIRRLKRSKCLEQQQAVGINHDLLVKMIDAQPDTLAGIRNKALLSLGYDFLARRSELVALGEQPTWNSPRMAR